MGLLLKELGGAGDGADGENMFRMGLIEDNKALRKQSSKVSIQVGDSWEESCRGLQG